MSGIRGVLVELLWSGARVNELLAYKQTALMHLRSDTPIEAVRDLLDAGAKVNLRDENGDTALMFAAERNRADVVDLLLKAGAKVNVQNKEGGAVAASDRGPRGFVGARPLAPTGRPRPPATRGQSQPTHLERRRQ